MIWILVVSMCAMGGIQKVIVNVKSFQSIPHLPIPMLENTYVGRYFRKPALGCLQTLTSSGTTFGILTTDNGGSWNPITTVANNVTNYLWSVPSTTTEKPRFELLVGLFQTKVMEPFPLRLWLQAQH